MEELDEFGIPIKKPTNTTKNVDEFGIPIKKKESTVLPSTTAPRNSGSNGGTTSSDTSKIKGFPKIDTNSVAPGFGVQPDFNAINLAKSKRIKELETSFYSSTKDNTDDAVVEQRLQDRKNNKGFWNTAEDLTKSVYNKAISGIASITDEPGINDLKINQDPLADEKKQALLEAKKLNRTISESQKTARAEEIFKQKEKDNLFIDRANSFLDNLDVKDKDLLQQDRLEKGIHLQEENKKKFNVLSAMQTVKEEKIKEYNDIEKKLISLKNKNQELPVDLYDKYNSLNSEINNIVGNQRKYQDQINKNISDLGTAQQEFDLFKRGYGDVDNFMGNVIATTGELANGLLGGMNYLASLSPNVTDRAMSLKGQQIATKIDGKLEEYRDSLRKPVGSIESPEGFVNYASDLVANQIPILAATSTGVSGLATLGLSTSGQTYTKLKQEVLAGKANYSPLQMAVIPFLQGGFEVISEIPTLSILKKGGRVIEAMAKGEADLIKKNGATVFKEYGKDFLKEFGGEHVTNLGQNFNAKYVQGKDEVGLLDNTGRVSKDTFFLTALLQGSPHVFGAVSKIFQSNSDFGTLDENSRKIVEFSKQLNQEGLSDTEKTVIQKQIDKATSESSKIVANTIDKIGDMPNVIYDEIISINSQAGKIKAEAKEIQNGKLPNKKELLTSLGQDYKDLQIKRSGLIDGSITAFDLLSGNEQAKRLTQASREITKRDNPEGTKEKFEVKPEDAKKLATENYLKELSIQKENEQNPPAPTSEAQPQAEVQKPSEAEKVEANYDNVKPIGKGFFGDMYDQFRGKTQEAIEFLKQKKGGEATGALSHPEIGDIDLVWGNDKAGLAKIIAKHPEMVEGLQDKINAMTIISTSENRIILESETEKAVVSKNVFGKNDKEWLLTAFEKRSGTASDSSIDIKSEPEGKQNGTAPLQNNTVSDTKIQNNSENEATPPTNTPADANVQSGASDVGEVRATEQEIPAKESVPSAVDGGENKGDIKVDEKSVSLPNLDDIADFIKKTYLNDGKQETSPTAGTNQGAAKNSIQENPDISKGAEKSKQKEVKLDKDGFVVISKKGKTPLSKRNFKGDRKEAVNIDPTDAHSLVLSYFAKGGKIASSHFKSKGELQARNNGINGIATQKAQTIDQITHSLWESQENRTLKLDTQEIKNTIEEVVHLHNTIQNVVDSLLKYSGIEKQESTKSAEDYYQAMYEAKEESKASEEEVQEVLSYLDQLTNAEIIELTNSQEKSFEDYIKDLEERQVTYDLGPFIGEQGTIQPDGYILSEKGELLPPESVSNVKQVNPKVESGKPLIVKTPEPKLTETPIVKKSPELIEVNKQLKEAIENERIAKEAMMKKMVKLDNELIKDNQDLFGNRKSDDANQLFNERVDPDSRNKALDKPRIALKEARDKVKKLRELRENIKNGKVKSTEEIDFKQQLKEKVNTEVDRIAQKVKDLLPGIDDPDLHTQGFSQDQLIDLIASAVKNLISAGIDINDAITQVIDSIKSKFGDIDVDIDAIKEKVNPTPDTFELKPGKKSLLNRAYQGGNSINITDAIEEHGLNYRIENQEEAKKRAEDFVNEVGSAIALEAVRSNQIKGAEKAFVYSTIIDNLLSEIESTKDLKEREQLELEHAKIISDITNEFSQESTDAGRFISALNKVYNSSKLRYNLTTQIESHKASNNGQISDEILEKFTKADNRIKELEKLIEEAEAKVKKAEEVQAIKNVQEDIERKKQLANKNKSGLTPKEQTRKKELKNKFFGRLNDATSMITMLADPEFREYLGLTFKQAKGDLENFSKRILTELGKGAKSHIPELFKEAEKSVPTPTKKIKIGKNGKLSIPEHLFRDYVEAGENDIDVISAKIKEDIADEFPDVDVREIRDALTGYGKQINPTKDDVSLEIARLKSLGKLISAYEDASNGISPLKSGLKRTKPDQQMRELKKEINRLIKENGLDAVDLEKQWASALDKIKSHLNNQIEDLDKQILNKERRKVERTTTNLDEEATLLKELRDSKKQILDDLVGKPELTEEQKINRAEKSLQTSIDKLQKDITEGRLDYNEKPTPKKSKKLDELRKKRQELVDTKNRIREELGLVEQQRLNNTKKSVRNQIENLKERIANNDYSKKISKPLIEDSELSQLRAEKLRQQEIYDAQKYADELRNRSTFKKWTDAILELWNVPRILKATGELSTVLVQGGILTVSRKLTNPIALAKIMKELFKSIGSSKKAKEYESLIKSHPLYPLAEKSKLALTNPDYKSDVREEQFSGDYANLAWDLPFVLASYSKKASNFVNTEKSILGDKIKKTTKIGKPGTDKLSIREQWKNINPFVALERGGTLYMNTLRMEEFVRGCEMLRMEGKNEVDHLQDYKLLANAINTMSGRANLPTVVAPSSKLLAAVFFSARNAVSIMNQVNPIYYGYLHLASTDGVQIKKTSVANKLAMTNMVRFVAITGMTVLAIKAAAGKDDNDEDVVQIETDPNSSDFMKIKIGDIRFDPWHGLTTMIVLMSRLITENVKSTSTGETTKLGEKRFGPQNRGDLMLSWLRNKFSPSAAITANYLSTHEEKDNSSGEYYRETPFGKKFSEDESLDLTPMYWSSVKEIQAENPGAMAEFLTIVSVFGWNTSVYKPSDSKKSKKSNPGVPNFDSMIKVNP